MKRNLLIYTILYFSILYYIIQEFPRTLAGFINDIVFIKMLKYKVGGQHSFSIVSYQIIIEF